MPTFQALPRFGRDWKNLTRQQQAMFRKVVLEAIVPDLMAPDRPFRPGLRVKRVAAHPRVFEMTWDNDGRATFSYGDERIPGQPHVIWRRIGTTASSPRRPACKIINPLAKLTRIRGVKMKWHFRRQEAASSDGWVASYRRGGTGPIMA